MTKWGIVDAHRLLVFYVEKRCAGNPPISDERCLVEGAIRKFVVNRAYVVYNITIIIATN